jgi:FMN phosphatase YigB (HAD superfamily)
MKKRKIIEVVGLDFDQTLVPVQHLYNLATWKCGCIISAALGIATICPTQLMDAHDAIDGDLMKEMEFNPKRFPLGWKMTYERLAKERRLRVSSAVSARLLKAARTFMDGPFTPYPGVPEALHTLRQRGKKLVVITAGRQGESLQWHKLRESGLLDLVDDVKISPEDKTGKMVEVFGDRVATGAMVGDSPRHDIATGQAFGLLTVLVKTNTWKHADASGIKADYEVPAVAKVPRLFWQIEHS